MCNTIQESSNVAVNPKTLQSLAKTATFLTNHSFRSEISRDHPLFATLSGVLYKSFLWKVDDPLGNCTRHETIQSCEVVLHNRPATFKRSYTHKLSYYNSVVSCWTITCMYQGAGPGSVTTGEVNGHKQWRPADSDTHQLLESAKHSCNADSNDCCVSEPALRHCLYIVTTPVVKLPGTC